VRELPAICPHCEEVILCKSKHPFLQCPECAVAIALSEAATKIEAICENPANIREVILRCIELQKDGKDKVARGILEKLESYHPQNEEVSYLVVRASNYDYVPVKRYLLKFAPSKKQVPFAEEFLDNAMIGNKMEMMDLFKQYIENKIEQKKQREYKILLQEAKEQYTGRSELGQGKLSLFLFFLVGALINIATLPIFIIIDIAFYFYLMIGLSLFGVEMALLFLHNRKYGNRIGMEPKERLVMVAFMCSLLIVVLAMVLGSIY
jgi:hypothetical protein